MRYSNSVIPSPGDPGKEEMQVTLTRGAVKNL